jgi:hypothetical protein
VTPESLLAEADGLRRRTDPGVAGCWPRACVWLTRLAFEQGLDRYWATAQPDATQASMRAQLLLLPRYAGADVARQAREAWLGLSHAAHHHPYESAPTATELRRWHDLVSAVLAGLTSAAPIRRSGTTAARPEAPGSPSRPGR